jgi:DNA-binding IclR family transcriptional regulator
LRADAPAGGTLPLAEPPDDLGLRGVRNALRILDVLADRAAALGVAEVGRQVNVPRTTAFRLLSALEREGFVEQDPDTRRYRLGLKLFELAGAVTRNLGLVEIAHPLLERLVQETQETAHLSIADRWETLVIDKVDSPREVYLRSHVGARRPAHCTSTGKVLLAFGAYGDVDGFLAHGLHRYTSTTITDPDRLREELRGVRERGYALAWAEFREEVAGVAAPVRDRTGRAVAALGAAGPIGRITPIRFEALARLTVSCAERISTLLGWWSAQPAPQAEVLVASGTTSGED